MRTLLLFIAVFWCSYCSAQSQLNYVASSSGPKSASIATITVNSSGSGLTIPPDFVGFSGEVVDFTNGFYQGNSGSWSSGGITGNAGSFIGVANLLGSHGVMRIGGGSADANPAPTITSGMSTNLNTFLTALGANWTLIYNVDLLGVNDPTTATTTASNITTAVGVNNVTFQMGNEPSLNVLTAAQYETRWNTYYSTIVASVASAKFAATDDIMHVTWGLTPTVVAALTPGIAGMQFIGQHWYSFCNGTWASSVPSILLNSIYQNRFGPGGIFGASNTNAGYLSNTGTFGSTPQRMSETNTICQHGTAGMSDRMMAATWFLNTAMVLAQSGWAGMNVHSAWGQAPNVANYNVFVAQADNNFAPGTIFYGMFLFSKIEGQQILPLSVGGNANVVSIATKGGNGNANIIAVNNDVISPVTVTPAQSGAWTTANVLQIKSPTGVGCGELSPTVGGQSIGEGGAWSGIPFSINNGQSITLGPCEAALIQIQSAVVLNNLRITNTGAFRITNIGANRAVYP